MGDWLQGSYIYPLYKSYGYSLKQIGLLFVIGFGSSATLGTAISSLADRYGRKRFALLYCALNIISCLTKLFPDLRLLVLGRVTGGIATSLLFSVFESWLICDHSIRYKSDNLNGKTVTEHREVLYNTLGWATFLNGTTAIISGTRKLIF
jgi:MFS family permease